MDEKDLECDETETFMVPPSFCASFLITFPIHFRLLPVAAIFKHIDYAHLCNIFDAIQNSPYCGFNNRGWNWHAVFQRDFAAAEIPFDEKYWRTTKVDIVIRHSPAIVVEVTTSAH